MLWMGHYFGWTIVLVIAKQLGYCSFYSLGSAWGDNGNFKIRLGIDEMSIESSAEYADPILVKLEHNLAEKRNYQYFQTIK